MTRPRNTSGTPTITLDGQSGLVCAANLSCSSDRNQKENFETKQELDPSKHFREQCWWRFDNFSTETLTRQQYASCYTDVENVDLPRAER